MVIYLDHTGSGNSHMADDKPEIPIFQRPGEICTQFSWLNRYFNGISVHTV